MAIKLIALDLDGTTLSSKKNISSRNRAAMESAAAKGVNIAVSYTHLVSKQSER